MRLSHVILAKLLFQSRSGICNLPTNVPLSNMKAFKFFPFCFSLYNNNLSLVRGASPIFRLSYSTKNVSSDSKNEQDSKKLSTAQAKKKKEIKVFITLLRADGNIISVTTVEEASKLAQRRNLRLVKIQDFDPKNGRAVYKLMTESEYLKDEIDEGQSKPKKEKENAIKGDKVVSLTSSSEEHDVLIKTKMMKKWLAKRFEVRVVISGDPKTGENVYKIIEKEIGTNGRIIQKRNKAQDIRFQIHPPKKTEPPKETGLPKETKPSTNTEETNQKDKMLND